MTKGQLIKRLAMADDNAEITIGYGYDIGVIHISVEEDGTQKIQFEEKMRKKTEQPSD